MLFYSIIEIFGFFSNKSLVGLFGYKVSQTRIVVRRVQWMRCTRGPTCQAPPAIENKNEEIKIQLVRLARWVSREINSIYGNPIIGIRLIYFVKCFMSYMHNNYILKQSNFKGVSKNFVQSPPRILLRTWIRNLNRNAKYKLFLSIFGKQSNKFFFKLWHGFNDLSKVKKIQQ